MSESFKSALGARLKDLRRRRGLTLEQVKELTDEIEWPISRSRLSALERGQLELKASDIYPLTRVYGFAVADLITESIVAHSRRRFAKRLGAKDLFEEGKRLFKLGQPLEAGWAFDEARRRAEEENDEAFRELCLLSAAHCYIRLRAYTISLRRIEKVIDNSQRGSNTYLTALSQAAWLHARMGGVGRSRLFLDVLDKALEGALDSGVRALILVNKAIALSEFGEFADAAQCAQKAAKLRIKTGEFDMAAKALGAAAGYLLQEKPGDAAKALRLAQDAQNHLSDDSEVETRIRTGLVLSDAQIATGENKAPRSRLMELSRVAMRFGYEREAAKAYRLLAKIEHHDGRESQARKWRSKMRALALQDVRLESPIEAEPRREG